MLLEGARAPTGREAHARFALELDAPLCDLGQRPRKCSASLWSGQWSDRNLPALRRSSRVRFGSAADAGRPETYGGGRGGLPVRFLRCSMRWRCVS